MKIVSVPIPGKAYDVVIETGLLQRIDHFVDANRQIVIITDDNIPSIHVETVVAKLPSSLVLKVPEGESSKSMEIALSLTDRMIEKNITRDALLIALGGGVVGDLAGFVAATYMRGIDYIQIPTTLLAQIDSSVGGKVAVNASHMKNAIGAFKQPKLVLIDPLTLETLEPRHFNNGMAEMIKYGLIASKPLFDALLKQDVKSNLEEFIESCVIIKKTIVTEDEYDTGIRQILNYGHTIGHALEQLSNYALLHGEAIAIGMAMMSIGMPFEDDLRRLLHKYDLPDTYEYDKTALFEYVRTDKKASSTSLNMIVVEEVGKGYIKPISLSDFKARL